MAVSLLALLASATAIGMGVGSPEKKAQSTAFQQDMEKVRSLGGSVLLDDLEKTAAKLERKWSGRDKEQYGYMVIEICNAFTSHHPPEDRQYELTRQYALRALEKSANLGDAGMPIEVELRLVTECIQTNYAPEVTSQGPNWSKERSSLAAWYFRAWDRLENSVDPNYDPNAALSPWPMPSKYDGIWMPGMSPDAVEDPAVRATYAKALEQFWAEIKNYNKQGRLRNLEQQFLPRLARQILRLYSGPSFDSQQLETPALIQDLQAHVADEHVRKSILDAVNGLIPENHENATPGN